ncbi:hypothetical protein C5U62_31515 [Pseudomonas protegens]|uniref:Uncharacterized protein n=1 Tax=Pseudomonas protegens TaxID=380021 RepID=A0A2T6GBH8_9PSED|nr:hypothetical protein [Pseudomonas protegens]PUA41497.1 hypothetical protein C5U62_31515 [Pseudomonas protegens]
MFIDIHERREDGGIGRLFDTIDIDQMLEGGRTTHWIEFDGESFPVMTGIRHFIALPIERLEQMIGRKTVKTPLRAKP